MIRIQIYDPRLSYSLNFVLFVYWRDYLIPLKFYLSIDDFYFVILSLGLLESVLNFDGLIYFFHLRNVDYWGFKVWELGRSLHFWKRNLEYFKVFECFALREFYFDYFFLHCWSPFQKLFVGQNYHWFLIMMNFEGKSSVDN